MSARSLAALALAAWLLPAAGASAKPSGVARKASGLVEELLEKADVKGQKLAVAGFADSDKRLTALSGLLADSVELELVSRAGKGGYRLMDRRNLSELADEWKLGVNGLLDDESAVQAGRLLGAEVLCVGKYSILGRKLLIRATLIGAEKGEILAAASSELTLDDDLRDYAARPAASAAPAAAGPPAAASTGPLRVELWTEKAEYGYGEKLVVHARANQDCYLTLIEVSPQGKPTVIFPNHYAPGNAVKAGVTYTIPDPAAGFEFEVSPPSGVELLRAIASKEPMIDLRDLMEPPTAEVPFAGLKQDVAILTR
ncbi:MAG: DUF4384 domain-containing protein, partial [Elusimicrobia bacterium]|nr:DUF4384 domain-containing protein [Elusimicrobiota bacterium]